MGESYPFKDKEYQECVEKFVYENMDNCERLAKCMKALNWKWADASADDGIPNAMEIHNTILNLFEEGENYILRKPTIALMKFDGSYTVKTGGLVLCWSWNSRTFELYDFEIMFDLWEYLDLIRFN